MAKLFQLTVKVPRKSGPEGYRSGEIPPFPFKIIMKYVLSNSSLILSYILEQAESFQDQDILKITGSLPTRMTVGF